MKTRMEHELDAYLERINDQVSEIQRLNLSTESDLRQALDESLKIMGNIARYRAALNNFEESRYDHRKLSTQMAA